MGHGKETPRQKMIGMMYLVLTALLALNVSKDILNAFVIVNNGLQVTNENFKGKNQVLYNEFEKQKSLNEVKVRPYYDAAMKVQKLTQTMCDSIFELKKTLIEHVEGEIDEVPSEEHKDQNGDGKITNDDKVLNLMYISSKDNYDIPTHYLCGADPSGKGAAAERFKNQLIKMKEELIGVLKDEKISIVNRDQIVKGYETSQFGLNTDDEDIESNDPADKYWETKNFYHLPIVACLTMLSKIENDVRNAESDVVSVLLGQIGAADFKFDTLAAKVIAKSNYVIQGDKYEAELFVAAFSTTDDPEIIVGRGYNEQTGELIGETKTIEVVNGVGKYTVPAGGIGPQKYSAIIKVKDPTGGFKQYPLKDVEYMVAKPAAVVSATKMNVFYLGVENPVSVSVSGFADDQVIPSISQGSITKASTGGYIVKATTAGTATVSVNVKTDNGSKSMGSAEFRVKRLPSPIAKVAGKSGGLISKNELAAQKFVKAEMENFDFDLVVRVTGFNVTATINGFVQDQASRSASITPEQSSIISRAKGGDKVYFDNVKAYMPDGTTRDLGSIAFKLQ